VQVVDVVVVDDGQVPAVGTVLVGVVRMDLVIVHSGSLAGGESFANQIGVRNILAVIQ
jgi:hypothetical protein